MFENLASEKLKEIAIIEGSTLLKSGAIVSNTAPHTGRSANAKFYVIDELTKNQIDWKANKSISPDRFENEKSRFIARKLDSKKPTYKQNARAVRDERRSFNVEFYTEFAVHSLFVRNMFIPTGPVEEPDFTVYHFPSLSLEPKVLISIKDRTALISGTLYSGEIKKSIFSVLNYFFPEKRELPMHCSANMSMDETNVAIFFGLSGTGKTTLSSDENRTLIGDDEHCWTSDGITNFEGGCYAKTIRLQKKDEPQIWDASHQEFTLLENVVHSDGVVDFDDGSFSENARSSYPFHYIENASVLGYVDKHPNNIIMLTCDAFGVLPPVSKLSPSEAYDHFLLGYTAKVAGTETGVKEPTATFSPCFGAPFMPRKPSVYASILKEKILEHKTNCWLVNTGWVGGPYGVGKRISISETRKIINTILDGSLSTCETMNHPYTSMTIPLSDKIDKKILFPELSWNSIEKYAAAADSLKTLFIRQKNK